MMVIASQVKVPGLTGEPPRKKQYYIKGVERMKVVVWKSPKFISGILRLLFKIEKDVQ